MRECLGGIRQRSPEASVAERVAVVAEHLAPIAGPSSTQSVIAVCAQIPGRVTRLFGFEVRQGVPGADLLIQLRPNARYDGELVRTLAGTAAPADGSVQRVGQILDDSASVWAARCNDVWLEYDLADGADSLPAPSLFFSPVPDDRAEDPGTDIAIDVVGLVRHLTDDHLGNVAAAYVELSAALAEVGARPLQHGMMLGRDTPGLRLCLSGSDFPATMAVLSDCGWAGDPASLLDLVKSCGPAAEWWMLDLDLTPSRIGPRLTVEMGPHVGREQDLLTCLSHHGHMASDWAEVLLRWPGASRPHTSAEPWPADLQAAAGLFAGTVQSGILRRLNHIKIEPGAAAPPKAYLAVDVAWAVGGRTS